MAHTMNSLLLPLLPLLLPLLPLASPLECTPAAFSSYLPSNAQVAYTGSICENGTFDVPVSDIAFPVSPSRLPAACVVQVNVISSPTSAYSFGLFLPESWNERFL